MAAADPPDTPPAAGADGAPLERKRRNWWIWGCVALAVVAVGLLAWGLDRQSALDSSQQDVAELEAQADQAQNAGSTAVAAFKGAYDDLTQQLGATNEDLSQTQDDLKAAEQDAAQAQQDAAQAKQDAADAKDQTEKANAEADQAKAEAQEAESKAAILKECARAYVSAIGGLFEGDDVSAQASAVGDDLRGITDDCSSAFGS